MRVLAISGPSCSGKSTLARFLLRVLPEAVLLQQDDFYVQDHAIPLAPSGVQNWDTPSAFDLVKMRGVIENVRESGKLPAGYSSNEERNDPGERFMSSEEEASLAKELAGVEPVLIVDGIMLYQQGSPVLDELDFRVLMPAQHDEIRSRRAARSGYSTIEGFWADPPGYFDDIVWPEFEKWYGFLYAAPTVASTAAVDLGISMAPATTNLAALTWWVVSLLQKTKADSGLNKS